MNSKAFVLAAVLFLFSGVSVQSVDSIPKPEGLGSYTCDFSQIIGDFDGDGLNDQFMIWSNSAKHYATIYSFVKGKYLSIFLNENFSASKSHLLSYGNIDNEETIEVMWLNYIFDYDGVVSKKKSP